MGLLNSNGLFGILWIYEGPDVLTDTGRTA
jgi:hypothetical protein